MVAMAFSPRGQTESDTVAERRPIRAAGPDDASLRDAPRSHTTPFRGLEAHGYLRMSLRDNSRGNTRTTTSTMPRLVMPMLLPLLLWCMVGSASASDAPSPTGSTDASRPHLILVVGAAGEPEFGTNFLQQASLWQEVARKGEFRVTILGLEPSDGAVSEDARPAAGTTNDLARLRLTLEREPKEGDAELWLVLIGHGTFDGREAHFNLRGPDLSASNLTTWLRPFRRPAAILNTASASAPFMKPLAAPNRVVVTATRSGFEQNFSRFGKFLAEAIADPAGDLDQDGQTSLLEGFLSASHRVAEFYQTEGRLATEHALIDDSGDGLGTPAEWFRGLRAVKQSKDGAALDGLRAHQFHLVRSTAELALSVEARARRDILEREIAAVRQTRRKTGVPEDAYFQRLEVLLLELARLYRGK